MKTNLQFVLSLCVLISAPSIAQNWTAANMNGGGYVTGLTFHPTDANTIVARTDVGGLYISRDGSNNWQPLYADLNKTVKDNFSVRGFTYKPGDAQTMYFISGRGNKSTTTNSPSRLWTSINGGTSWSWEKLPFSIDGNEDGRWVSSDLIIDPTNTNKTIIGAQPSAIGQTDGGVWFRNSTGSAFQQLSGTTARLAASNITKVAFKPGNTNIIYFAALNVIGRATTTTSGGFYKYDFSSNSLTVLFEDIPLYDFDFDAGNPDIIVMDNQAGVYKFDVSTNTRTTITPTGATAEWGHFVTADPTTPGKWYIGSYAFNRSSIFYTTDGGATYKEVRYNNFNNVTINSQKLDYSLPYNANNRSPNFGNYMSKLIFSPLTTGVAYISDFATVWKTSDASNPFTNSTGTTRDNNAAWTWRASSNGIHILVPLHVSVDPSNSSHFFLHVADEGYWYTKDKGSTMFYPTAWANQTPSFLFLNQTYRTYYSPIDANKAFLIGSKQGTGGGRFEKSTDKGDTWTEPATTDQTTNYLYINTNTVSDIAMPADGSAIIVGVEPSAASTNPHAMLISTDEGATWNDWSQGLVQGGTLLLQYSEQEHLLKDADGINFYAWSPQNINKRNISASTWSQITLPSGATKVNALVPSSVSGTLYASLNDNNIWKLENATTTPVWTKSALQPFTQGSQDLAISPTGRLVALSNSSATATTESAEQMKLLLPNAISWTDIPLNGMLGYIDNMRFVDDNLLVALASGDGCYFQNLATVLPIDIIDFKAVNQNCLNTISFTLSSTHENGAKAIIEKNKSANLFTPVSTINILDGQNNYSFKDENIAANTCYRLQLQSADGIKTFSSTQCVTSNCSKTNLSGIFITDLNELMISGATERGNVLIYNNTGQLIKELSINNYNETFLINDLPTGIYLAKITAAKTLIIKFFKK